MMVVFQKRTFLRYASLHNWLHRGWVRASIVEPPSRRWVIWAHAAESYRPARRLLRRFNQEGLQALMDLPRSGRPPVISEEERGRLVMLARKWLGARPERAFLAWLRANHPRLFPYLPDDGGFS